MLGDDGTGGNLVVWDLDFYVAGLYVTMLLSLQRTNMEKRREPGS